MNSMLIDFDDDEEITINATKKQKIISELLRKNLIQYGSVIPEIIIEEILDKKKKDISFEKWTFIMLQIREIIKELGYYITSRGRNGDLYILYGHEMPSYNDRKTKNVFKNLKQRQRALYMIDASLLSSEHQKKLEFEMMKNARIELEMANAAKQRCR